MSRTCRAVVEKETEGGQGERNQRLPNPPPPTSPGEVQAVFCKEFTIIQEEKQPSQRSHRYTKSCWLLSAGLGTLSLFN